MKRIAVVIVTYNRWNYLTSALTALLPQLGADDAVFVVDNGSSDGTRERLAKEFPSVRAVLTDENVGGAGGFAFGIDLAIAEGYSYAWLMDDDGEPAPDALAELLVVMDAHPEAPWWTSTTWFYHGTVEAARNGELLTPAVEGTDGTSGTIDAWRATFVGLMVNLAAARRQPLPVADFFIWHDDSEYTARLSRTAPGVRSLSSRIIHPYKENYVDFGERLRYDVRNRLWILRHRALGSAGLRREELTSIPKVIAKQAIRSKRKSLYVRSVVSGLSEGMFRRPRIELPGELISRWGRWIASSDSVAGDGTELYGGD